MTELRWDPARFRLELRGHAGRGRRGEDLCCAAVSALAFALVNAARAREDYHADVELDPAGPALRLRCRPEDESACREMFRTALTGFRLLREQYPEHVRLEEGEG